MNMDFFSINQFIFLPPYQCAECQSDGCVGWELGEAGAVNQVMLPVCPCIAQAHSCSLPWCGRVDGQAGTLKAIG